MATEIKTLKNGDAAFPYWGKKFNKITGLDPLGQQNASEKIYTHLMPGITNLTNRIRYYGFYSWLLSEYERIYAGKLNQKTHRQFIRRGELAISLIMNKMNPSGITEIPGSNTANELLRKYSGQDSIGIKDYADDNKKEGAYWKYATGALGQYYVSSLRHMGLLKEMVVDSNMIYMVTDKGALITGKDLAKTFDQNLQNEAKKIFLDTLESGHLSLSYVDLLYDSFNITNIPSESNEWKLYWELMNGPDTPTEKEVDDTYRSETIKILKNKTEKLENGIDSASFMNELFHEEIAKSEYEFSTKFAWFQYRLNEFWQFSCGTVFWSLLHLLSMEKNGIYAKNNLINEFAERVFKELKLDPESDLKTNYQSVSVDRLQELGISIQGCVKAGEPISAGANALKILLMLLEVDQNKRAAYLSLLRDENLDKTGGYLLTIQDLDKEGFLDRSMKDFFMSFIDTHLLFRHRLVAFNKLGNGSRSTLKFEMEDDFMLYDGNFEPSFTNPRVDTLLKILSDLSILKMNANDKYDKGLNFSRAI